LISICIPASVSVLGKSCFERATMRELNVEGGSKLRRIDEACFRNC
jgi:hypothetical protein